MRNFLLTGPHANYPFVLSAHLRQRLLHANVCLKNLVACDRLHHDSVARSARDSQVTSLHDAASAARTPEHDAPPQLSVGAPWVARFPCALTTSDFSAIALELAARPANGIGSLSPAPSLLSPSTSFYSPSGHQAFNGGAFNQTLPPATSRNSSSPQSHADAAAASAAAAAAAAAASRDWASQLAEELSELQVCVNWLFLAVCVDIDLRCSLPDSASLYTRRARRRVSRGRSILTRCCSGSGCPCSLRCSSCRRHASRPRVARRRLRDSGVALSVAVPSSKQLALETRHHADTFAIVYSLCRPSCQRPLRLRAAPPAALHACRRCVDVSSNAVVDLAL